MKEIDIIQQIKLGEVSKVQFKERLLDNYDIGCELVAFSNARGGTLVVGVKDKTGSVNPLSYQEVQETTNTLSNIASENVIPAILVDVETISVDGGSLVVAHIKEGLNKPYHDNRGIVWVKNGADKRKVFDNAELAEMMTECGSFSPDEAGVRDATIKDLDESTIKIFLGNKFEKVLARKGLVGDTFREASLDTVCSAIASGHNGEKLLRNLRFIRPDGKITVAAMLLFGKYTQRWLPVMTAKCICFVGTSMPRNMFLFTNAIHLLPYTGAGSGMLRALSEDMKVSFTNNDRTNEFVITINRQIGNQVNEGSSQVREGSNQVNVDLDTKLRHSDISLDTNLDTLDANLDTKLEHSHADQDTNLDTKRLKITNKQRDIVNFCSVPRSSKEILERVGVTNHSKNRQTYIMSLVEAGYLEMTNPEHPNASNQKYRRSKR